MGSQEMKPPPSLDPSPVYGGGLVPAAHVLNARLLRYRSRPEGEDARGLAQDLLQAQRYGDARGVAVSALGEDGEDAGLLVLEGRAWLMERDLLRAQAALLRAVRSDRDYAEAYRWLGEVLLARGDAPRALRALEKAVSLNPDDAEAVALREHARTLEAEREARAAEAEVATAPDVATALEEERITPVPVEVLEAIDEVIASASEAPVVVEPPVAESAALAAVEASATTDEVTEASAAPATWDEAPELEHIASAVVEAAEAIEESEQAADVAPEAERIAPTLFDVWEAPEEAQAAPAAVDPWEPWEASDAADETGEEEAALLLEAPDAAEEAMEALAPESEGAEPAPVAVAPVWEAADVVPAPPAPAAVWEPPLVAPLVVPPVVFVVPAVVTMPAPVAPPVVPMAPPVVAIPIVVAAAPRVPPRPPPVPKVEDLDVEPVTLPPLPPQPYDDHEPELHAPSLPPDALDDSELESDPAGPDSSEPPPPVPLSEATGSPLMHDAVEAPSVAPVSYAPAAWSRSVSPSAVRRVGVGATALLLCAGAVTGWTLRARENAEHAAVAGREHALALRAEADARAKAEQARRAATAERAAREQAALAQAAAAEVARKAAAEAVEQDVPARLGRVDDFLAHGRLADAQAELAAIPEAKRDAAPVREAGARVALARGLPGDALVLLEPLAGARAASASLLALHGHALYRLDRVNVAASAFDRALARDASLPEALIGRAEVHLRAERPGDALALLDRAEQALARRTLAPDWRARMYMLSGRAYVERHGVGDKDLAVVALQKALALGSAPAETYFWLGEALGGRNTPPASDAFKKYLQREPTGRYVERAKRALGPLL